MRNKLYSFIYPFLKAFLYAFISEFWLEGLTSGKEIQ